MEKPLCRSLPDRPPSERLVHANLDESEFGEQHLCLLTVVIEDDNPEVRASFRNAPKD